MSGQREILICPRRRTTCTLALSHHESKDRKSTVVSEAEQMLVREAARRATQVQEATDKQSQARWREAEGQLQEAPPVFGDF